MQIHPIRNDQDLERALARVDALWGSPAGTSEGDELDVWLALVEHYEARHHAIPPGDPIDVIEYKLAELGWSQRELGRRLGWGAGRVSEVLGRKRGLTLAMVQQLAGVLEVDPALLVGVERPAAQQERSVAFDTVTWAAAAEAATTVGLDVEPWVVAAVRRATRGTRAAVQPGRDRPRAVSAVHIHGLVGELFNLTTLRRHGDLPVAAGATGAAPITMLATASQNTVVVTDERELAA